MYEVRAAILKLLYDLEKNHPRAWTCEKAIADELGLTLEETIFHLEYLEQKGLIKYQRTLDRSGGGMIKITALGIDAVEAPEQFVKDAPFLQQLIIYGNVVNSTILQAESVRIRNGLNRIIEQVDDVEIRKLIEELISESYEEKPDANRIKATFNKIKQKAPEIAEKISPIVIKLLERWLNSS
jgi:hypothetical protein